MYGDSKRKFGKDFAFGFEIVGFRCPRDMHEESPNKQPKRSSGKNRSHKLKRRGLARGRFGAIRDMISIYMPRAVQEYALVYRNGEQGRQALTERKKELKRDQ